MQEAVLGQTSSDTTPSHRLDLSSASTWLVVLGAAAYYVGARIGFNLAFPTSPVSALWLPNAILLSMLLLVATSKWWLVFSGVFVAHVVVQLQSGVPMPMIVGWFISNSTEALIGAVALRFVFDRVPDFASLKSAVFYVAFAVLLAPFLSSFLDAAFVTVVGWKGSAYWQVWLTRFSANTLAAIAIPPFIVLWCNRGVAWLRHLSPYRVVEGLLLIAGLIALNVVVFQVERPDAGTMPALLYLPLPFLLWAAVRFGSLGSSTAVLLVVLGSVWGAVHGRGPFVDSVMADNVSSLQMSLIAISLPVMLLAGLVEERAEKAQALSESEARFRSLADTAPVLMWMSGTDKGCTYVNQTWVDFTGRPIERELGSGWIEGVHRDDVAGAMETYTDAFGARKRFTMEYRLRRYNGEY